MTVLYLHMNFILNSFLLCSLGWNLDGLKMRKVSFDFRIPSIFKLKIQWNCRLEFFWKNLHRNYLVTIRFPFETTQMYVRSIFFAPFWRKITQCDCASLLAICKECHWRFLKRLLIKRMHTIFDLNSTTQLAIKRPDCSFVLRSFVHCSWHN